MLSQHIPLFVGGSLGKEVDIEGCVSEFPPVVVIPGSVGYCSMTFTGNTQETGTIDTEMWPPLSWHEHCGWS